MRCIATDVPAHLVSGVAHHKRVIDQLSGYQCSGFTVHYGIVDQDWISAVLYSECDVSLPYRIRAGQPFARVKRLTAYLRPRSVGYAPTGLLASNCSYETERGE